MRVDPRGQSSGRGGPKLAKKPAGGARPGVAADPRWPAALQHPSLWAALAAVLVYLQSLLFPFVRDDRELIESNAVLHAAGTLPKLLTSDFWASTGGGSGAWRPLILLSYWVDGRLGHWTPALFHAMNVAGHACASALLAAVMLTMGVPRLAALFAALWFAALPAHVESVAWISGRTDVYCAAFALLALRLDRAARARGRTWPGPWPLLAFSAALLCKEAAAPFVVVVAAAEWARTGAAASGRGEIARWLAPYAALTAVWLVAHSCFSDPGGIPAYVDAVLRQTRQWSGLTQPAWYVAFLWPWYPHTPDAVPPLPTRFLSGPVLIGATVALAVALLIVLLLRRRSQALAPLVLFVTPLLPPILVAFTHARIAFGERMLYLPSAGAAWMLGLLVGAAESRGVAIAGWTRIAAAALVLASAYQALRVSNDWASEDSMYRAMIRTQPRSAVGYVGLAENLARQGQRGEALASLETAERLDPRLPSLHLTRAALHLRYGEWDRAIESADRALALDSLLFEARLIRATSLMRLRRTEESGVEIQRLLHARPDDPGTLAVWGQDLLLLGRTEEAAAALERAARVERDDPAVWFALGNARAALGQFAPARAALERTLEIDPRYYGGWLRLASLTLAAGDTSGATQALRRALALPDAKDGRAAEILRALERGAR